MRWTFATTSWPSYATMPATCWAWCREVSGRGFVGWWGGDGGRWLDPGDLGVDTVEGAG